jgi:two-component system chemotaxis response regulator CheB
LILRHLAVAIDRLVVIGASAGGVAPLRALIAGLNPGSRSAFLVVLHIPAAHPSLLANILGNAGSLTAVQVQDGMPIEADTVYVAEPDHHMRVVDGKLRSLRGPKENRARPSINVLFRSAAATYANRTIGIILSGSLDDGTVGLWEIKQQGGIAIVQDPNDAIHASMPQSAVANVDVDYVIPASDMPALVNKLVNHTNDKIDESLELVAMEKETNLTCPECRGALREIQFGRLKELQCRVGHSYSPESAWDAHQDTEERTLWAAVVALQEGADFARRLAAANAEHSAALNQSAEEKLRRADVIRNMLTEGGDRVFRRPLE